MHLRFLLTSAATAALITTAAVPVAHAQGAGFLESKAAWAVSKVSADGPRNAYCAVAKKFGSEIILTIARNMSSETSFAIDFQNPKFNISQEADVILDPGAGQQRNYKMLARIVESFRRQAWQ